MSDDEYGVHSITIAINPESGNFTYSPSALRAKPGDEITFKAEAPITHFEIVFNVRSPSETQLYFSHRFPKLTIDRNADIGTYHYAVAVFTGDRVFIDSECGQVGVGNPPAGY